MMKMTDPSPPPINKMPVKQSKSAISRAQWGLLPQEVIAHVLKKEWLHLNNLKSRLLGSRPFPIRINLKVPNGRMAIKNLPHFQNHIESWQSFPHNEFIEWEIKSYRTIGKQRIPRYLTLHDFKDLILVLGKEAKTRGELWKKNMSPFLELSDSGVYPTLIKHLGTIEKMPYSDCLLIKRLIEQLYQNMGTELYLRALPIKDVDTKFLETNQPLVSDLLDTIHNGQVTESGGLLAWLDCLENPKGFVYVRPLSSETQNKMAGLPIMLLPIDVLRSHELQATNILIVENIQSGLGLPKLKDTIAVFGGGRNVAWMDAHWLKNKRVAYWGDIDTHGLAILSDVRTKLATVTPLMMDTDTLENFEDQMVIEPTPVETCPINLTDSENDIYYGLKTKQFKSSRLEQERLPPDYILLKIREWLSGDIPIQN